MSKIEPLSKNKMSADWLVRGVLTKIGDSFDRLTGRRWIPSSSIAASELIERIKKLLDSEAKEVAGKGMIVPHNIKLKMQWDKFSDDAEDALKSLEIELLTAAVDHINNSLYYTYAPLSLEVKPDYFTEGVKLYASFDKYSDDDREVELSVTVPAINVADIVPVNEAPVSAHETFIARYEIKGIRKEIRLDFLVSRPLSVGRTGANALVIDDPSVSKIHASLVAGEDGILSVADTGSTNGTFINDQRISYGKATRLEEGDRLKFGLIEVMLEHVPRPILLEVEDKPAETPVEETIAIDGFEFKRRVSPETPTEVSKTLEDTSPAIPIPDETLRIDLGSNENEKPEEAVPEAEENESDEGFKTEV